MAEFCFWMFWDVGFDFTPIPFSISNFFSERTYWDNATKYFYFCKIIRKSWKSGNLLKILPCIRYPSSGDTLRISEIPLDVKNMRRGLQYWEMWQGIPNLIDVLPGTICGSWSVFGSSRLGKGVHKPSLAHPPKSFSFYEEVQTDVSYRNLESCYREKRSTIGQLFLSVITQKNRYQKLFWEVEFTDLVKLSLFLPSILFQMFCEKVLEPVDGIGRGNWIIK